MNEAKRTQTSPTDLFGVRNAENIQTAVPYNANPANAKALYPVSMLVFFLAAFGVGRSGPQ
jgi:hypothetical protein